jgi:hypothetical protein
MSPDRRTRHALGPDRRGTALLLAPVAVLVVCVLGVLAVDTAALALVRRDLAAATAAAANDAATVALDRSTLYTSGAYVIDADTARRVATRSLAAGAPGAELVTIEVAPGGPDMATVVVTARVRARRLFLPTVDPDGGTRTITVVARATVVLRD